MKPNTKTKFSDRFSTKVEDIRPKKSQQNQEDEKFPDDMPDNLKNLLKQNRENKQNDQLLSFNDGDLAQVMARTRNVKTLDEATLLQIELQSMMLLTLKAMDWKLWEIYNLTKGK